MSEKQGVCVLKSREELTAQMCLHLLYVWHLLIYSGFP